MEMLTMVLTDEQIEDLEFMGDFYGEKNKAILMKLALKKFVKSHFAEDISEEDEDQDLEKIRGE